MYFLYINLGYRKDVYLKIIGVVIKLMVIFVEVGDVMLVELIYKKKGGFLGFFGGGDRFI